MATLALDVRAFMILIKILETPIADLASHFFYDVIFGLCNVDNDSYFKVFLRKRLLRIIIILRQNLFVA